MSFPEGGLPCAKLTELMMYECGRLEALPKGLHNLNSLRQLIIGDEQCYCTFELHMAWYARAMKLSFEFM